MSFDKELCIQGWKYQFGIDVEKSLEKAFDFYKQAADLGDGEGMFQIAEFYHLGIHVKKDRNKAFEYFQKSASTGFEMGIVKKALCYRYGYGTQENFYYSGELLNTLNIINLYVFAPVRYTNYNKICENCNENITDPDWCQMCNPDILIQNWTSNNKDTDDFMKRLQLKCRFNRMIAWFSYDCLTDIKEIGKGGLATVYKATCLGGIIFKEVSDESKRNNHIYCNSNHCAPHVYGLTLNPTTGEYIMIFQYAEDGNLVNYLKKNWQYLKWDKRIKLLSLISYHLSIIHELGLVHADLHSGNILCYEVEPKVSDLEQSRKINENNEVYGVLPYVDPVILQGGKLTQKSDIYGFGIIMWVIATGRQPYDGLNFNIDLSLQICQGLRPEFDNHLPKCYVELAVRCLNKNQENRPTAKDINKTVEEWRADKEIMRQFKIADEYRPQLVEQILQEKCSPVN
ncbi:kinase-like domain-containing protein [Gigaspora rosea]|uniref:Kinase-like domain-containing protein n=1 Tax=Gigaspora rosea TaxID=44941 RepID=A0A397V5Q1_9GLOM|nr:kinase-like domain-containing protein [Gigaspora rosea]